MNKNIENPVKVREIDDIPLKLTVLSQIFNLRFYQNTR